MRIQADAATPRRSNGTVPASRRTGALAEYDAGLDLTLTWTHGPPSTAVDDRDAIFRLPAPDDPEPDSRRVLAMALWAMVLGVLGPAAASRTLLGLLTGHLPDWYLPALVGGGLTGIALTVGAFLTLHRPWAPWWLLCAATVPLVVTLTANARIL